MFIISKFASLFFFEGVLTDDLDFSLEFYEIYLLGGPLTLGRVPLISDSVDRPAHRTNLEIDFVHFGLDDAE